VQATPEPLPPPIVKKAPVFGSMAMILPSGPLIG
jgi:hypothetical protein